MSYSGAPFNEKEFNKEIKMEICVLDPTKKSSRRQKMIQRQAMVKYAKEKHRGNGTSAKDNCKNVEKEFEASSNVWIS